jgi:hypothetical protein
VRKQGQQGRNGKDSSGAIGMKGMKMAGYHDHWRDLAILVELSDRSMSSRRESEAKETKVQNWTEKNDDLCLSQSATVVCCFLTQS